MEVNLGEIVAVYDLGDGGLCVKTDSAEMEFHGLSAEDMRRSLAGLDPTIAPVVLFYEFCKEEGSALSIERRGQ